MDAAGAWVQQAYVKASNSAADDLFGLGVALSGDGSTLAVGAPAEDGSATGIDGDQADRGTFNSGAVYVYTRDQLGAWSQHAYVKASNTSVEFPNAGFGVAVALSGDGRTLVVGASGESGSATGIDGDQAHLNSHESGAAYVFTRDQLGTWTQQAYVKASNTEGGNLFGTSVSLSADGSTLAVGAQNENSDATGIDGESNGGAPSAGAAYVYTRDPLGVWRHQAYVKAPNTGPGDSFGLAAALSGDGQTLAIGAYSEDSNATGIDGDQTDNSTTHAGAAYLF